MKIIPVIDVMRGKVVQARRGDRHNYQLLQSIITDKYNPIEVIEALLALQAFQTVYIADLDAIMDGEFNSLLYADISGKFPTIQFLLDAGIKNKDDWNRIAKYSNIKPIIGSETLVDPVWLEDKDVKKKSILSLDFKQGQFLGDDVLLNEQKYWPAGIIVMNLDCIGSEKGPDLNLLIQIKACAVTSDIFAAGGVRNIDDLNELKDQNIEGVLVASALHDGRLTKEMIRSFY